MSKKFLVSPGRCYVVTGPVGTTITATDGTVINTIVSGSTQCSFIPSVNEVTVDPDTAKLEQVRRGIAVRSSNNGGGGDVTSDGNNVFTGNNAFTGTVTFSGTVVGLPEGPKGDPGQQGEPGESAYQIWLDTGHQGTEEDFLESLKGPKGDTGAQGNPGAQGDPGQQGEPGESAYQIWIDEGNSGTEEEFLESLKGPKGDTGEQGPPGADGAPGQQGPPGKDGSPGVIIPITGQTVADPAAVNMGDELVFSTDAAIAIDTILSVITSEISIGWTVRNTGSATISVTKLGEEIASVDAGSSVSGKWIRTSDDVYISVFKRALGEGGNSFVTWGGENYTEVTFNVPADVNIPVVFYNSNVTKVSGTGGGIINCSSMFSLCSSLTSVSLTAPSATNCHYLCSECSSLTELTLNLPAATNCSYLCPGCSSLTELTLNLPAATDCFSLCSRCSSLTSLTLELPLATNCRYIINNCTNLTTLICNFGAIASIDFTSTTGSGGLGNVTTLQNVTVLEGGLASCTSFIITNSTNLTDTSIQNIIDALPDYSGTETSALVSFPPDRLTTEQQTQLSNKGWTWS